MIRTFNLSKDAENKIFISLGDKSVLIQNNKISGKEIFEKFYKDLVLTEKLESKVTLGFTDTGAEGLKKGLENLFGQIDAEVNKLVPEAS